MRFWQNRLVHRQVADSSNNEDLQTECVSTLGEYCNPNVLLKHGGAEGGGGYTIQPPFIS